MNIRTYILITLLLFALLPVFLFLGIGMPPVIERLQIFFEHAHLQRLRADFRDLDQHLASRQTLADMLSKVPIPGVTDDIQNDSDAFPNNRTKHIAWINRLLRGQLDIIGITYVNANFAPIFWLERNPKSLLLSPAPTIPGLPQPEFMESSLTKPTSVLVSPIYTETHRDGTTKLRLHLVTPIKTQRRHPAVAIVMTIAAGGLARTYRDTIWVQHNGQYLYNADEKAKDSAFDDFKGLNNIFSSEKTGVWNSGDNERIMWVPMFRTDRNVPLWVGRRVDVSPIAAVWNELGLRLLGVLVIILVLIWLLAHWISNRLGRASDKLASGIQSMLEKNQAIRFHWQGPKEINALGKDLTRLSRKHAENAHHLHNYTRELERSNQFKTEFIANVSHELKTPLNSILVLSKLLKNDAQLNEKQHEQAAVINKAGEDLNTLISNILDLSRLERLDDEVQPEDINLLGLIDDIKTLLEPQFKEKQLELKTSYGEERPINIVSDSNKIRQILNNLLSNALKFTESGSVSIDVSQQESPEHPERPIQIRIADTGMGISADDQQQIFEAFRQADGSIRRKFGGTGLGLYISKRLAELLGGKLYVESNGGQGTVFILSLPLEYRAFEAHLIKQDQELTVDQKHSAPSLPEFDFKDTTLLAITTDVDLLLDLTRICSPWGVKIIAAEDDEEILEAIKETSNLIVLIESENYTSNKYTSIKANPQLSLVFLSYTDAENNENQLVLPLTSEKLQKALINTAHEKI